MATQVANYWKYYKLNLLAGKTFKMLLMNSSFVFSRASHKLYADVSANELTTANGYTVGGLTLSGIAVSQDDTNNRGKMAWSNASWTASGTGIVASFAIIIDTTDNVIAGCIDFGGSKTALAGSPFVVASPMITES
jgi:hypothetical protein